jgi:hypothetical protein
VVLAVAFAACAFSVPAAADAAFTARVLWSTNFTVSAANVASAMIIANGVLVVQSGGAETNTIMGVEPSTGSLIFNLPDGDAELTDRGGLASGHNTGYFYYMLRGSSV